MDEAGADIVAVAHPGDGLAGDRAAMLLEGHQIGQDLARVALVGEAVDHRHGGRPGEGLDVGMADGADHHRIDHAREHPGGVLDGLAAAELHVGGRGDDAGAAKLADGRVEGEPRPRRILLEDHRQGSAGGRARRRPPRPGPAPRAGPCGDLASSRMERRLAASIRQRSRKCLGAVTPPASAGPPRRRAPVFAPLRWLLPG